SLQLDVFEQQLVIVPLDKPARLPRLRVSEPESVRMYFLTHSAPELSQLRRRSHVERRTALAHDVRRTTHDSNYFFATAFLPTDFFFATARFFFAGAGAAAFSSPTTVARSPEPFFPRSASEISMCAMRRT